MHDVDGLCALAGFVSSRRIKRVCNIMQLVSIASAGRSSDLARRFSFGPNEFGMLSIRSI